MDRVMAGGGVTPGEPWAVRRLLQRTLLLAVVLTPIFTAGEVLALFAGLVRSQSASYTPIYVKALKDVLMLVAGALGILAMLLRRRGTVLLLPLLILLLYVAASSAWVTSVSPQLSLAGLRWIFPVVLCVLLVDSVDRPFLRRLADITAGLFVVHLGMQGIELFFMSGWFGRNALGLAARVPGMFFLPNTASFYAIMTLFLAHFHGRPGWRKQVVHVLVPLSVLMTQSGTGLIVYLLTVGLMYVGRRDPRRAVPLLLVAPVAVLVLLPLLPFLTGRGGNYVSISGGGRVAILLRMLQSGDFFPQLFGHATNTAVSFATNLRGATDGGVAIIADSTYASIVGNLGWLGTGAFVVASLAWGLYLLYTPRLELYVFSLILALFAATTLVTEAYPMSLLTAVLLAGYFQDGFGPLVLGLLRRDASCSAPVGTVAYRRGP